MDVASPGMVSSIDVESPVIGWICVCGLCCDWLIGSVGVESPVIGWTCGYGVPTCTGLTAPRVVLTSVLT